MNTTPPNPDTEHLRLLSVFHYVWAGISALCACFPIIHFAVGLGIIVAPKAFSSSSDTPPQFIGWLFVIFASVIILMGWTMAGLTAFAGKCLATRKRHTFCIVVAAINCLSVP